MIALFARTFVIGVAVAAPVGAMAILCIDRTLRWGWRAGLATGLGIATADAIYGGVAAFGVTAVSALLVAWQTPLRVVGGLALVALGVRSMLARSEACPERGSDAPQPASPLYHAGLYGSAVGLTLTNPMTIVAFAAVFVSAGITAAPGVREAGAATLGVASGSLAWWLVLVTGTALLGQGTGPRVRVWLSRVSGAVIALFGLLAALSPLFAG